MSSIGFFELHVGFPEDDASQKGMKAFQEDMRRVSADWTHSEVAAVKVTRPGCIDPHNVPGTLSDLVSLQIRSDGRPWDSIVDDLVVPICEKALESLNRLGLEDVRLEIEYPFGYCSGAPDRRGLGPLWLVDPPVSIADGKLRLKNGARLSDVPTWEIHFVVEKLVDGDQRVLQIDDIPALLAKHGVHVEQTIQYRSESMRQRGEADHKFIATAYYETAELTEREAKRLLQGTALSDTFTERGYSVTLVLEHIVACFQPSVLQKKTLTNDDWLLEVTSA